MSDLAVHLRLLYARLLLSGVSSTKVIQHASLVEVKMERVDEPAPHHLVRPSQHPHNYSIFQPFFTHTFSPCRHSTSRKGRRACSAFPAREQCL